MGLVNLAAMALAKSEGASDGAAPRAFELVGRVGPVVVVGARCPGLRRSGGEPPVDVVFGAVVALLNRWQRCLVQARAIAVEEVVPRLRYGVTDRRVVLNFFGVGGEIASKEDEVNLPVAPSSLAGIEL